MSNIENDIRKLKTELEQLKRQSAQMEYQRESAKAAVTEAVLSLKNEFEVDNLDDAYTLLKDTEDSIINHIETLKSIIKS